MILTFEKIMDSNIWNLLTEIDSSRFIIWVCKITAQSYESFFGYALKKPWVPLSPKKVHSLIYSVTQNIIDQ